MRTRWGRVVVVGQRPTRTGAARPPAGSRTAPRQPRRRLAGGRVAQGAPEQASLWPRTLRAPPAWLRPGGGGFVSAQQVRSAATKQTAAACALAAEDGRDQPHADDPLGLASLYLAAGLHRARRGREYGAGVPPGGTAMPRMSARQLYARHLHFCGPCRAAEEAGGLLRGLSGRQPRRTAASCPTDCVSSGRAGPRQPSRSTTPLTGGGTTLPAPTRPNGGGLPRRRPSSTSTWGWASSASSQRSSARATRREHRFFV